MMKNRSVCPPEALPLAITKALMLATNEEGRPLLAFIHVVCCDGVYTCEATNGNWMAQFTHTPGAWIAQFTHRPLGDPNTRDDGDWLIPLDVIKTYIKTKGETPLTTGSDPAEYPDISHVIPKYGYGKNITGIGLDARFLMDWGASVKHLFGRPKNSSVPMRWQFTETLGPVRIDAEHPALAKVSLDSALWVLMPLQLD